MENIVEIGKVFSDINRVRILLFLKKYKEVCVCEICDTLKLSQPLVSRHLKMMKRSNLIESIKVGKWAVYKPTENKIADCLLSYITTGIIPPIIKCDRT